MIVENDLVSAFHVAEIVKRGGHDVTMAEELYCLDEIRGHGAIDVVITDIFLQNTSGLQIVLDVKRFNPDIKVVAMSSGGVSRNFDYLDYAVEFGADAVVRKPVDAACLISLLERFAPPAAGRHGLPPSC
ncbi:MAG: response regulator [Acidobacteriota bacterium]